MSLPVPVDPPGSQISGKHNVSRLFYLLLHLHLLSSGSSSSLIFSFLRCLFPPLCLICVHIVGSLTPNVKLNGIRGLSVSFGVFWGHTSQLHGGEQDAAACHGPSRGSTNSSRPYPLYGGLGKCAAVSIAWNADTLQHFCLKR